MTWRSIGQQFSNCSSNAVQFSNDPSAITYNSLIESEIHFSSSSLGLLKNPTYGWSLLLLCFAEPSEDRSFGELLVRETKCRKQPVLTLALTETNMARFMLKLALPDTSRHAMSLESPCQVMSVQRNLKDYLVCFCERGQKLKCQKTAVFFFGNVSG